MTDTIEIDRDNLEKGMNLIHEMEDNLDNDKTMNEIQVRRRQAAYHMNYVNWAENSIRVMASYTVLLIVIFLSLLLIYFFGETIGQLYQSVKQRIGLA